MVYHLDAVRNGGADEEGVRRGGRQWRECNGAHPPINKNWWGVLTTMMTKNTPLSQAVHRREEHCLGEVYESRSRLSICDDKLIMDLIWFKLKKKLKRERACIT